MSRDPKTLRFTDLSAGAARSIDEVCDCFEHQIYTGSGRTIEELLTGFQEPQRSILLRELLLLEIEQTVQRGEQPNRGEYFKRFPKHALIIRDVLSQLCPDAETLDPQTNEELPNIPNYRILRSLRVGGMGAVYEAMHTKLGSLAAIKVLRKNLARDVSAEVRFEREMRVIGTLTHPNIVSAKDAGKSNGIHYLVMEYLVGCDLAQLVASRGPIRIDDACEITRRVALALGHAHQHQLVHRDIKPRNILIGRSSGSEGSVEVKVADFGLALLRGYPQPREISANAEIVGTFPFMAPEQFWEQTSDIRSDIYSLGCTLHYLLAAQPPFSKAAYPETRKLMEAHRNAAAPPLRGREDVDQALQSIIFQMLSKDPASRQQTPAEVADQVAAFTDGYDLDRLIDTQEPGRRARATAGRPIEAVELPDTISASSGADALAIEQAVDSNVSSQPSAQQDDGCGEVGGRHRRGSAVARGTSSIPPKPADPSLRSGSRALEETPGPNESLDESEHPIDESAQQDSIFETTEPAPPRRARRWRRRMIVTLVTIGILAALYTPISRLGGSKPVDLMAAIRPDQDAISGQWQQRSDGVLLSPDESNAQLALLTDPPPAYRLEIEARRKTGGRMVIGLVHDGRQFPIVLDAAIVGSNAKGNADGDAELQRHAKELGFTGGRPNTYTCIVHPKGILVASENQIRIAVSPEELSSVSDETWRTSGFAGLFVGTQHSIYEFHQITMQPLTP